MQDESGGPAGLAEVSEALLAQWLKQTEQQMQHGLQELVQALQQQLQQQLSVQQATVASAELAGIAQSQRVQQQNEQQLLQLRQLLLNAEEEKKEVLTAMTQLAAQLRLSQDEFQAEKQQHALTLQQLSALQQQVPPAGHLAELEQEVARLRQLQQEWQPLQHKLESQLFRAQARAEALEERQLSEAEQGRDTIRELRQQLSLQREHYEQQLQSVQLQATEFRLKFEYAQQQLQQLPG